MFAFLSVLKLIKLVNIVRFSKEKRPKSDGYICEGGNFKFLIWALYISKLS